MYSALSTLYNAVFSCITNVNLVDTGKYHFYFYRYSQQTVKAASDSGNEQKTQYTVFIVHNYFNRNKKKEVPFKKTLSEKLAVCRFYHFSARMRNISQV